MLTYRINVTIKANIRALGIVRSGSLVSSDIMATVLKPKKAKKIIAAPLKVPLIPFGKNGVKLLILKN